MERPKSRARHGGAKGRSAEALPSVEVLELCTVFFLNFTCKYVDFGAFWHRLSFLRGEDILAPAFLSVAIPPTLRDRCPVIDVVGRDSCEVSTRPEVRCTHCGWARG